jgi:gliding motility-associated-like protein
MNHPPIFRIEPVAFHRSVPFDLHFYHFAREANQFPKDFPIYVAKEQLERLPSESIEILASFGKFSLSDSPLQWLDSKKMTLNKLVCSKFLALGLLFLTSFTANAQLQVTTNGNASQLVNQLIGPGIVVSNVTMTAPAGSAGTFLSNGSNIGLPGGVILTSGDAINAIGPNISTGISTGNGAPGDTQLDVLTAPFFTEDACILEFDMVATCDTIQISYVFGSDEYDEWVCTSFTDAFAFFISGPGIVGSQNIAIIPGTGTPVAINTVNNGVGANAFPPYPANCNPTNTAYFTTNNTGTTVEYDGFTVPLIAKSHVIPCSTYHIKLVIADAGDDALDSGVFLEQNGIRCTSTAIQVTSSINTPGYLNAIEGCVNGRFVFTRSGDTTQAQTLNYTVGGTATPAFDYNPLPGSVTFPAMASSVIVNVNAISDGLAEGFESVMVILTDSVCSTVFSDTAVLFINDQIIVSAGPPFTICEGTNVQLGAAPQPGITYTGSASPNLNNGNISNPIFQNATAGTYVLSLLAVDTSGCQGGDTTSVHVLLSPTATFNAPPNVCQGEVITITYTGNAPANANYTWNFSGGTVISGSGQGPYQVKWNTPGNMNVSLSVTNGICISQPVVHAVFVNWKPVLSLNPTNPSCFGYADGGITATIALASGPFTFAWSNSSNASQLANLPIGTYSLSLTDVNGCRDTASVTLTQPTALVNQVAIGPVICHGSVGTLTSTTSGGTAPYSYAWSNGPTTSSITAVGGNYTLTVTDAQGCNVVQTYSLIDPPQFSLSVSGDPIVCNYDTVVLTPNVGGGTPPYQYQWTSSPAGVNDTNLVLVYDALQSRTYTLDVVDDQGCTSQASFHVESQPRPFVDFTTDIHEACDSATVMFINNSVPLNSTYLWEFEDGTTSNVQNPLHWFPNGVWGARLTVTSAEGCMAMHVIPGLVHIIPTPEASFTSDPRLPDTEFLLLSEATITFYNTSPFFAHDVVWSFGNGDSANVGQVTYTYPDSGLYYVTLTAYNLFGCHDDTTQSILILSDPSIWVPTAFTPNGDGLNDVFLILGLEVKTFEINIFDRWGKMIFKSTDMAKSWDGNIDGQGAPEGVYVYKIIATTNTGKADKSGTVTLIR